MSPRRLFFVLGSFSIGLAVATRVFLSSGALEFEGVGPHGEPKGRWLGQRSSIPVYGPQPLWVFKTTVLTGKGKVQLTPPSGRPVTLDVTKADQAYLPMYATHTFWPSRHSIEFEHVYDAWVRQVSGQIVYPPLLIPIPLLMTRGVSDPEPADGGVSLMCGQECIVAVLHASRSPSTVFLELAAPGEATSAGEVVDVASFASLSPDLHVSLDAAKEIVALEKVTLGGSDRIPFAIPAACGWYKLRITAKAAPGDPRKPAVKILLTESPAAASN